MTEPQTPQETGLTLGSDLTQEQQLALLNQLSEGNFVPRVELLQANSAARRAGIGTDGEYVHNGTTNLGKQFVAVFTEWRPHAIMFDDDQNMIAESFDPASETFKSIKAKEQGPKVPNERPGTGADFLVWIPEAQVFGIFPLMKTARRHIKPAYTLLMGRKPAVISSSLVEARGNAWYSPVIQEYRGTIDPTKGPTPDLTEKAVRMFRQVASTAGGTEAAPADNRPR